MPFDKPGQSVSCAFLKVPTEIRVEIYRHLLSSEYIKRKTEYEYSNFETAYHTYRFHTQILCTNKQVYEEAAYVLYTENLFVRFTTNHPMVQHFIWQSRGVLSLTLGDCPSSFGRLAMNINHYCPVSVITQFHEQCDCTKTDSKACLLVSDQLPHMLRTLMATSQQGGRELAESSFKVDVLDTFPKQSIEIRLGDCVVPIYIRKLLDPFTLLYGLTSLEIKGAVNQEYQRWVISSAKEPEPTVAGILNAALVIRDRGDEAFEKQQFDLSLSLYRSALREFQDNRHWTDKTRDFIDGEFTSMEVRYAMVIFQYKLQCSLAAALLKVKDFQKATEHAKVAIELINPIKTPPLQWSRFWRKKIRGVSPFYSGALAYEGLGDFNRALFGMGGAVTNRPSNERYVEEYKRLEMEMEKRGIEPTTHPGGKGTSWWAE